MVRSLAAVASGSHSTPMIHPASHRLTSAVQVPLARPGVGARLRFPETAAEASRSSALNAWVTARSYRFCFSTYDSSGRYTPCIRYSGRS